MKAVFFAAGEGARLRPLTADRPKGVVEVDETPIHIHCFRQWANPSSEESDACQNVQLSNQGKYEISEAIDLPIQSRRTTDAIRMGWRVDIGSPASHVGAGQSPRSNDPNTESDVEGVDAPVK